MDLSDNVEILRKVKRRLPLVALLWVICSLGFLQISIAGGKEDYGNRKNNCLLKLPKVSCLICVNLLNYAGNMKYSAVVGYGHLRRYIQYGVMYKYAQVFNKW